MISSIPSFGFALVVLGLTAFGQLADQEGTATAAPSAAAPAQILTGPTHILAATEVVEIKVFQEPELTTTTRIPEDGRIVFPLIGDVVIAGKSVQEATRLIHARLQERFLVNPQVTITVVEPAQRLFTVLGQVQRPGTYRFPDRQKLDLIQVIGIAGGYTRLADPAKITIRRRTRGTDTVLRIDGKQLARDEKIRAVPITSGDLITVGERLF